MLDNETLPSDCPLSDGDKETRAFDLLMGCMPSEDLPCGRHYTEGACTRICGKWGVWDASFYGSGVVYSNSIVTLRSV